MSPTIIWGLGLALAFCRPLAAANGGHTYFGTLDFKKMGWDAAFGDPDIVHDDWHQAGNTRYRVNIAAANVPRPEHGGNVSSAIALSLLPYTDDDDDDDNLLSLSKASNRPGPSHKPYDLSTRDEQQKLLGPSKPSQDGTVDPLWDVDKLKDLCVTVHHLDEETQARARYDHGDCRSFLSNRCMDDMVSEARHLCENVDESSREPLVRTSSTWCAGSDSAVSFNRKFSSPLSSKPRNPLSFMYALDICVKL